MGGRERKLAAGKACPKEDLQPVEVCRSGDPQLMGGCERKPAADGSRPEKGCAAGEGGEKKDDRNGHPLLCKVRFSVR